MIFIFIVIKVSSPISAYPLSEFDLFQGPIVVVVIVVVVVVVVVVIIIVVVIIVVVIVDRCATTVCQSEESQKNC